MRHDAADQYHARGEFLGADMGAAHDTGGITTVGSLHLAHAAATATTTDRDAPPAEARHAIEHRLALVAGIVLAGVFNQDLGLPRARSLSRSDHR